MVSRVKAFVSCLGIYLILLWHGWAIHADGIPIPQAPSFTPEATLEKETKYFPHIKLVQPELPYGVRWDKDLVYHVLKDTPYGERALHLDVLRPELEGEPVLCPAVVMVHGGGWRSGSKRHMLPMAQQLADKGYVAVPVEYRLALEARYPATIHDVKCAIRWLRAHAATYGIDPDRIAVLGCSSGAQVVTLIAATNHLTRFEGDQGNTETSSEVQAVINIDGVVSFIHPEAEAEIRGNAASTWFGSRHEENPDLWKDASPLEHVGKGMPPILFVNSSVPRFHAGRNDMIRKLDTLGIYSEVHAHRDSPHPFWLLHPWFEPTVGHVRRFLDHAFPKP